MGLSLAPGVRLRRESFGAIAYVAQRDHFYALDHAHTTALTRPASAPALIRTMAAGWTLAARVRNALTLVRGRPTDQLPRHGVELAGVVQILGGGDPGEFVDSYLRVARRSRTAMERVLAA